jgi:hypothetical protein
MSAIADSAIKSALDAESARTPGESRLFCKFLQMKVRPILYN